LKDKLSEEDKTTITDAMNEHRKWLDANAGAEKEEFEDHLKEVQGICDPIINKHAGGSGSGGAAPGEEEEEAEIDL